MLPANNRQPNGQTLVRCAIYTRKSTEEGLEQSFNTLDAQRDAAESYISSQRHEGWIALPEKYDDGGYTGANMDRPALKRLLEAVKTGAVNCIVVYKVDRLTRSLLDFARIMEVMDRFGSRTIPLRRIEGGLDRLFRMREPEALRTAGRPTGMDLRFEAWVQPSRPAGLPNKASALRSRSMRQ
jgi:hypothetical protein